MHIVHPQLKTEIWRKSKHFQRIENVLSEFDEVQMLFELNYNEDVFKEEYSHRETVDSIFSKTLAKVKNILKQSVSDSVSWKF